MDVARKARENHVAVLRETESLLRRSFSRGKPVDAVILSLSGEEEWLRPLVDSLARSPAFAPTVVAVPDKEASGKSACLARLRSARRKLADLPHGVRSVRVRTDSDGEWCDVLPIPGIVFYASASDRSDFRYNPHYAVGRNVLPVLFFDRHTAGPHPLEKEFARQNYAYFWKVFFTDREAFDLYRRHSLRKGENAVLFDGRDSSADFVQILRPEFCP